jgi:hypothetical protein
MSTGECELYCSVLFKCWLRSSDLMFAWPLIAQGHDKCNVTQGPTGGPEVVGSSRTRALSAWCSKWYLQRYGGHHVLSSHHIACMRGSAPGCRAARHCSCPSRVGSRLALHCSGLLWVANWPVLPCCGVRIDGPKGDELCFLFVFKILMWNLNKFNLHNSRSPNSSNTSWRKDKLL